MSDFNINNIDFENVGSWPLGLKLFVSVLLFLAVAGGWYWFITKPKIETLESAQVKEKTLRDEFRDKQKRAANLDAYKAKMAKMNEIFSNLQKRLPKSSEVPGFLDDIAYNATASNANIISQDFADAVSAELYVERPINIVIEGSYHQLGAFVDRVSSLSRIVTLHDFSIKRAGNTKKSGRKSAAQLREFKEQEEHLTMDIVAKTYQYDSERQE